MTPRPLTTATVPVQPTTAAPTAAVPQHTTAAPMPAHTFTTAVTAQPAPAAATPKPANPALVVTAAAKRPVRQLPAAPPPVAREPEPQPQRGLAVHVFRIVAAQVAVILGLVAIGRPWPDAVALGVTAAVLLAVGTIRIRDRWLSATLVGWAGLLLRRTKHDCGSPEHEPSALLSVLTPDTTVRDTEVGGTPAAVLSKPDGLVAVLRPRSESGRFLGTVASGFAGQLVLHAGPRRDHPTRVWLAVRARRDVDAFADEELAPLLANAVRRTLRKLDRAGTPAELLSEKDLVTAVVGLSHTGSGRGELTEDWRYLRSGSVAQTGFRLTGLDRLRAHDRIPVLERLLAVTPGVAVTAAVVTDEPWGAAAVLRVAGATGAAVDVAAAELGYVGERLGVRLERLDGRHAHAVAATLPIGGEPL